MSVLKSVLVSLLVSVSACSCAGKTKFAIKDYPSSVKSVTSLSDRQAVKEQVEYMKERTVQVSIDCTPKKGVIVLGSTDPEHYGDGRGSGVIVQTRDGKSLIATANHVVVLDNAGDYKGLSCTLWVQQDPEYNSKGLKYKATIKARSKKQDVAILEVEHDYKITTELEAAPVQGETVWALGYPLELSDRKSTRLSTTKGVLAVPYIRKLNGTSRHRVTAEVYFGNSGGGLWTDEGKLLGIVVSIFVDSEMNAYPGYYYATPVDEVNKLLEKL